MRSLDLIVNAQAVVAHFDEWPTFHDAEITSLQLDREAIEGEWGPTLTLKVHGFLITSEVLPSGYLRLIKHAVVTFQFFDVVELQLTGFNYQNVVGGISFEDIRDRQLESQKLQVGLMGCFGVECNFQCRYGRVLSVEPGVPLNSQYKT